MSKTTDVAIMAMEKRARPSSCDRPSAVFVFRQICVAEAIPTKITMQLQKLTVTQSRYTPPFTEIEGSILPYKYPNSGSLN